MSGAEERLTQLGLELPEAPAPAAAYVPVARAGEVVYVSGQVAVAQGRPVATGKLGGEVDTRVGTRCARQCAVNVLAQLRAELGSLDRVRQVVRLGVFVASDPAFTQQHVVANGASELVTEVFGQAGLHARAAVGVPSLPMDSPVEVEAVVLVD
ncbi:MAG: RidA family protein [Actinomycetota bacterium]|nr:RidA family protein [Actinomycetota bacterium]